MELICIKGLYLGPVKVLEYGKTYYAKNINESGYSYSVLGEDNYYGEYSYEFLKPKSKHRMEIIDDILN